MASNRKSNNQQTLPKNSDLDFGEAEQTKNNNRKFTWLNFNVIATVLVIKALILIFAAQSFQTMSDRPITEANWFWNLFGRWDAGNYLKIAQFGYVASGDDKYTIVFFPLYPALIALFNIIFGNYVLSALVVSGIASLALGLSFRELVKLDFSEKTAQLAVLFLFIFPTSYFLHIPYTESLFLTLIVCCFLSARKRNWLLVGILGAMACLTRINGLILIPALAFEVLDEYRETRQLNRKWIFLVLIPAGFGGYLALNYYVSGDPTMFLIYQRENFQRYLRVPWEAIWEACKRIYNPKPTDAQMIGIQELLFVIIGLSATIIGWRYLRKSYLVWMALNWLLFVSTSFILSVPRYTLIMFPIFILMARAARRDWHLNVLFIVWSILFLSLFFTQFIRGWWAF
jgi:4-amino-4-deoxy-L-arabinose transferase-like glycosyltransferase